LIPGCLYTTAKPQCSYNSLHFFCIFECLCAAVMVFRLQPTFRPSTPNPAEYVCDEKNTYTLRCSLQFVVARVTRLQPANGWKRSQKRGSTSSAIPVLYALSTLSKGLPHHPLNRCRLPSIVTHRLRATPQGLVITWAWVIFNTLSS
jgi:hypothetical protein